MAKKISLILIFFFSHIAIFAMGQSELNKKENSESYITPKELKININVPQTYKNQIIERHITYNINQFFSENVLSKNILNKIEHYAFNSTPFFYNIPEKYKNIFSANITGEPSLTTKDFILIKGHNKATQIVYINNEKVYCDQKGNFSFSTKLTKEGINNIYITFKTINNKFICIVKKINKLNKISNDDEKLINLNSLLFMNSDIINKNYSPKMNSEVLRKDLAYFLYHLNDKYIENKNNTVIINDINKNTPEFQEIQYSIEKKLMGLYPNNKFYPNKTVSKLEAIIAFVRVSNYSNKIDLSLEYHDFNKTHWAAPYVQIALENNIIKQTQKLHPNQSLTYTEFTNLALNLPNVKKYIQNMKTNQKNHITTVIDYYNNISNMIEHIINTSDNRNIHFELTSYKNNSVVYEKNVTLNGYILPAFTFKFANKTITPSYSGNFKINLELKEGINTFNINHNDTSKQYTLYHLNKFDDLDNHWIHDTAAKLKYLGLVDNTTNFNPTKNISREDFVKITLPFYMQTINTPNAKQNINIQNFKDFKDFSTTQNKKLNQYVNYLVNQDIFTLTNNYFYPKKSMTRIEALAAIVKYENHFYISKTKINFNKIKSTKLPYWDIPKNYWGTPYIYYALQKKWISSSHTFNPNIFITKDQFYSILTKSNIIDINF